MKLFTSALLLAPAFVSAKWESQAPLLEPDTGINKVHVAESSKLFQPPGHNVVTKPKAHKKRPDSHWDYIVKGDDVHAEVATNGSPDYLRDYAIRGKSVDPKKLKVDTVKQYAGYLDDKKNDKHLFYWFFESRNNPDTDPVVLWLNGGPGCSSIAGLFMELGPSMIQSDLSLKRNAYAWNANASVIFLDQPVNVGYSYSESYVNGTVAAGKDVFSLLTLFFKQFPEYADKPFHIAGESYAGHYIPQFAHEILAHNSSINLQSVLIGNGLTDPAVQSAYYRGMLCGEGGYPAIFDRPKCQAMANAYPRCAQLTRQCYDSEEASDCRAADYYCNDALVMPFISTGLNPYDIRERCESGGLCYVQMDYIEEFMNKADVMAALGAEVDSYTACSNQVGREFNLAGDWGLPFHRLIPGLLEKIAVLIYAGDADFICNWLGNRAWVTEMQWPGMWQWRAAPTNELYLSNDDAQAWGTAKTAQNLTFLRVYQAGHMVPMDQPAAALDMLNRWVGGEWME